MTEAVEGQARQGGGGKGAVRRLLCERLTAAGLQRPRGMTAAVFDQMQAHLCDRLAYMTGDNLMTLADVLIEDAQGGRWPVEAVIRDYAKRLQRPPATSSRIITSWLGSVEGPKAVMRGDLVELYRLLLRSPRPPSDWDRRQVAERAVDNRRRLELIRDRMERNTATEEDRGWLAQYMADQEAAQAIVDEGDRKRAEGAAA